MPVASAAAQNVCKSKNKKTISTANLDLHYQLSFGRDHHDHGHDSDVALGNQRVSLEADIEVWSYRKGWVARRLVLTNDCVRICGRAHEVRDVIILETITRVSNGKLHEPHERLLAAADERKVRARLREGKLATQPRLGLADDMMRVAEVVTRSTKTHRAGEIYNFRFVSQQVCALWIKSMKENRERDIQLKHYTTLTGFQKVQYWAKQQYTSFRVQMLVALAIMANFVINIAQAESTPKNGSEDDQTYGHIDLFFTIIFSIELLFNMLGSGFREFCLSGWNQFDFFVVFSSLVTLAFPNVPGVNHLRTARVLRVMRLFGRVRSLRLVVIAIAASLIPVLNAMVILGVVSSIFAILGQSLFAETDPELFATYSSSMLTMFQISTGDAWASAIMRPLMEVHDGLRPTLVVFFVFFTMIMTWFLLQVLVAVLYDNFVAAIEGETELSRQQIAMTFKPLPSYSMLDPIVRSLRDSVDRHHLESRVRLLFKLISLSSGDAAVSTADTLQGASRLSRKDLKRGLEALPILPRSVSIP
jgi:hypothetical protein